MPDTQYARNAIFDVLNMSHPQSLKSSHPSFSPHYSAWYTESLTEAVSQKVDLKEVCTQSSLHIVIAIDLETAV
jgi:hypothetical protein